MADCFLLKICAEILQQWEKVINGEVVNVREWSSLLQYVTKY